MKKRWPLCVFLLSLAVGLFAGELRIRMAVLGDDEFDTYMGLHREEGLVQLAGNHSFLNIVENQLPKRKNFNNSVFISPGELFWARVFWDGQSAAVQMLTDETMLIMRNDSDQRIITAVFGTKKLHFAYKDFDADGRFDEKIAIKGVKEYRCVRVNNSWVEASYLDEDCRRVNLPLQKPFTLRFNSKDGDWHEVSS